MVVVVVVDVVAAVVVAAVVADRRAVPVILVFDFGENILCSERRNEKTDYCGGGGGAMHL